MFQHTARHCRCQCMYRCIESSYKHACMVRGTLDHVPHRSVCATGHHMCLSLTLRFSACVNSHSRSTLWTTARASAGGLSPRTAARRSPISLFHGRCCPHGCGGALGPERMRASDWGESVWCFDFPWKRTLAFLSKKCDKITIYHFSKWNDHFVN